MAKSSPKAPHSGATTISKRPASQVRSTVDVGQMTGFLIALAGLMVLVVTLVQVVLISQGWAARLALFAEGLIWTSLLASAGTLLMVLSQALRCLYDFTYRNVTSFDAEG